MPRKFEVSPVVGIQDSKVVVFIEMPNEGHLSLTLTKEAALNLADRLLKMVALLPKETERTQE